MNNDEQMVQLHLRLDRIDRDNAAILEMIHSRLRIARVETDESVPRVLQITKLSETSDGVYIRVRV